jgi:predicted amidohydrolase YtcJ
MLDLRLVNANVVTMDPARPAARVVGVWQGRILGLDEDVAGLRADREVDLAGATVLPGLIDPHVHLSWTGMEASNPNVSGLGVAEALAVIGAGAAARPPGDWVDVDGYDQRALGRHLTAAELDSVGSGRKVLVMHKSGHACVVSTAVLALLPGVPHQDGLLAESGMAAVRGIRRPYSAARLGEAIELAGRTCLAEGVTAAAEAGIAGGMVGNSAVELVAYQQLAESGRLPVRMRLMVAADVLHPIAAHPSDNVVRGLDLGLRSGLGDDRLAIGALKIFTDGGMMARTAAMTEPYHGLDHAGQLFADPSVIHEQVLDGHRAGWQLAIHAIGDRAVDLALDALEAAQRLYPRPAARHRIEHAGVVRPDQLPRFAAAGAMAVVQPNFLWYLGDDYAEIMGEDRAPWMYRSKAFLDNGVRLVASSDRPVTPGAPLRGIQFLAERTTPAGLVLGESERISVTEAIRAYTLDAAFACHWEHALGSVTPGKHADLVVLAQDPRTTPVSEIAGIEVLATVVAGQVVHGSLPGQ